MTVVIGMLCEDGAVVGSDSSATLTAGPSGQLRTIEQPSKKTFVVGENIIFAGTGQVGLGQRFESVLRLVWQHPNLDNMGPLDIAKLICVKTIEDFASTNAPRGEFGAVVAFAHRKRFYLYEFAVKDLQPEMKTPDMWFVSMGSGQVITDPFLGFLRRAFFQEGRPTLSEGVFAVNWALKQAIELNTGGINGPAQIGVLESDAPGIPFRAKLLSDTDLSEHNDAVVAVTKHLGKFRDMLSDKITSPIPSPDP